MGEDGLGDRECHFDSQDYFIGARLGVAMTKISKAVSAAAAAARGVKN